jgi:hypothetical protein
MSVFHKTFGLLGAGPAENSVQDSSCPSIGHSYWLTSALLINGTDVAKSERQSNNRIETLLKIGSLLSIIPTSIKLSLIILSKQSVYKTFEITSKMLKQIRMQKMKHKEWD